jgi:hypothetical protein
MPGAVAGVGIEDHPDRWGYTTVTLTEFLLARIAEDEQVARDEYRCNTDLRWTPVRVLAECETKRRVITFCRGDMDPAVELDLRIEDERDAAMVLRLMATLYADHPDYREEWRP